MTKNVKQEMKKNPMMIMKAESLQIKIQVMYFKADFSRISGLSRVGRIVGFPRVTIHVRFPWGTH